ETLGYAASFSSPWREKRRPLVWRKPLLTDQLQPSTNADKLSDRICSLPHYPLPMGTGPGGRAEVSGRKAPSTKATPMVRIGLQASAVVVWALTMLSSHPKLPIPSIGINAEALALLCL